MTHITALHAILSGVLACAVSAAALPALAQTDEPAPRIIVQVADINLQSQEGAKVALGRIEKAADLVCGGRPDSRNLGDVQVYRSCRGDAVQGAVASLNQPMLSALVPSAKSASIHLATR